MYRCILFVLFNPCYFNKGTMPVYLCTHTHTQTHILLFSNMSKTSMIQGPCIYYDSDQIYKMKSNELKRNWGGIFSCLNNWSILLVGWFSCNLKFKEKNLLEGSRWQTSYGHSHGLVFCFLAHRSEMTIFLFLNSTNQAEIQILQKSAGMGPGDIVKPTGSCHPSFLYKFFNP